MTDQQKTIDSLLVENLQLHERLHEQTIMTISMLIATLTASEKLYRVGSARLLASILFSDRNLDFFSCSAEEFPQDIKDEISKLQASLHKTNGGDTSKYSIKDVVKFLYETMPENKVH